MDGIEKTITGLALASSLAFGSPENLEVTKIKKGPQEIAQLMLAQNGEKQDIVFDSKKCRVTLSTECKRFKPYYVASNSDELIGHPKELSNFGKDFLKQHLDLDNPMLKDILLKGENEAESNGLSKSKFYRYLNKLYKKVLPYFFDKLEKNTPKFIAELKSENIDFGQLSAYFEEEKETELAKQKTEEKEKEVQLAENYLKKEKRETELAEKYLTKEKRETELAENYLTKEKKETEEKEKEVQLAENYLKNKKRKTKKMIKENKIITSI